MPWIWTDELQLGGGMGPGFTVISGTDLVGDECKYEAFEMP